MLPYPTIIFILQMCLFDEIAGDFKVTLSIFSGRRNPEWIIPTMLIANQLTDARNKGFVYHPDGIPERLGFRGFLVKDTRTQTEELIVGPETGELQTLLLNSMPIGLLPSGNLEVIKSEMRAVKAKMAGAKSVKRSAPSFDPNAWNNDVRATKCNNCYNYATARQTNNYAQPGYGSTGLILTKYTKEDIKEAAISDGLKVEVFNQIPAGSPHLVALVVDPDDPGGNYIGDFHFYRLDSNLYWSHKQGDGIVKRAKDNNQLNIVDPKQASENNVLGRYEFVAYMTCDKNDYINVKVKGNSICPY